MIRRGDNSFSFFSKDSTYSRLTQTTGQYKAGGGIFLNAQIGIVFSEGWTFGVGVQKTIDMNWGVYGIVGYKAGGGYAGDFANGTVISFKASQEIKTSDSDIVTGEEGDVFFGGSLNYVYGLTDSLTYDPVNYQVDLDTVIAVEPDSIETTFIYTESHIRNVLLPDLRILLATDTARADEYLESIIGWERELYINDSLKSEAVTDANISFSSGTEYTYYETTGGGDDKMSWNRGYFELDFQLGAGAVAAGCTYESGYFGGFSGEWGTQITTTVDTTETYGYTFKDDDLGDFFSVDVKYLQDSQGNKYGAPFFDVVAGVSSCPWEDSTQSRDGVQMNIDSYVQNNVPPEDPGVFILSLGNISPSGESREYYLSVIQASNLDGAVIRVGGVVIEDHLSYTLPAGEQLTATMSVERGPIAYDYENLQVRFYSPCDGETIADTVTFSVHYTSPCSEANLLLPENNWVLNQSDNDTMQIIISEYDVNNIHLENIKFQYRRFGENWQTAFFYPKNLLPSDYISEYWDISNLTDGDFELRVLADCGSNGINYSSIAEGVIDRQSLLVFGTPEPADGVLNIGENISISFSDDIDASSVNNQNVSLMSADDSTQITIEIPVYQNTLIITPLDTLSNMPISI